MRRFAPSGTAWASHSPRSARSSCCGISGVEDFGRYATVMSLIAIVSGVTDAGLTAVGARDLPLRQGQTSVGAARQSAWFPPADDASRRPCRDAFASLVGYENTLVLGTLRGRGRLDLNNAQATMMLPLHARLKIGRVTAVEVLRQTFTAAGIVLLVVAGASLLPFFAVQIAVGVAVLALTPIAVGRELVLRPGFDASERRMLFARRCRSLLRWS